MPGEEQKLVARFTATQDISAVSGNMADAFKKNLESMRGDMARFKGTAEGMGKKLGEVGTTMTTYTKTVGKGADAHQELMMRVRSSAKAVDENARSVLFGGKTWVEHAKGVFAGVAVYHLASTALRAVRGVIGDVGSAIIGFNAQLEQSRVAFTNFLGSAAAADVMLEKLYKFAAVTPFQFPELVDATRRMMAFGFSAEEVLPMLNAIGNAAAGLATGSEGIRRMTIALGQMAAKGKVRGQEMIQLGEAGIRVGDVFAIIAQKMGVSVQKIADMQEKGKLSAQDFIEAFKEYSKLHFGDMMAAQAKTFNGAMSTIKDIMAMTIARGFEPLFKAVSKAAYGLALFMQTAEFSKVATNIQGVVVQFMDLLSVMGKVVNFIANNFIPILSALASVLLMRVIPATIEWFTVTEMAGKTVGLSALLMNLQKGFMALTSPIGLTTIAISILTAAFLNLYNEMERNERKAIEPIIKIADEATKRYPQAANAIAKATKDYTQAMRDWGKAVEFLGEAQATADPMGEKLRQRVLETYKAFVLATQGVILYADGTRGIILPVMLAGDSLKITAEKALELEKEMSKLRSTMGDAFGSIIQGALDAGQISLQFADAWRTNLPGVYDATDRMKMSMSALTTTLKGLPVEAQRVALSIVSSFAKWSEIKDPEIFARTAMNAVAAVEADSRIKAAQVKAAWVAAFAGIAAGISAIVFKEPPKVPDPFASWDIDKKRAQIMDLEAELPQLELRLLRIQGLSKTEFDWKFPDPNQIRELEAAILKNKASQAELNNEMGKMVQHNADIAGSSEKMYQSMLADMGKYFAKWVWTEEQKGKISKGTADALLYNIKGMYGEASVAQVEFEREVERVRKLFEELGPAGSISFMKIVKATIGAEDRMSALKDATDKEMAALKAGEVAAKSLDKIKESADTAGITMKEKLLEPTEKLPSEAAKAIEGTGKEIVNKLIEEVEAEVASSIDTIKRQGIALAQGLMAGLDSEKTAMAQSIQVIIAYIVAEVKKQLGMASPSTVFAGFGVGMMQGLAVGITSAGGLPVEAVVGQIQRILNLFADLSVDPRIKEIADAVRAVVDAFGSAVETLGKLATYTGKGVVNVEKAFNDMKRITDRFVQMFWTWWGNIPFDKVSEFGNSVGSVLDAFGSGLDALSKLVDYTSPARAILDKAIEDILYIARRIGEAGLFVDPSLGESLSAIGEGISSLIEPLTALRDYVGLARDRVTGTAPALEAFMTDLQGLFGRLGYLAIWLAGQGDLAEKMGMLGGIMASIFEPLGAGLEILTKLADYVPLVRIDGIAVALEKFMQDIQGLFGRLGVLADWLAGQGTLADRMQKLGTTMAAVFSPLKDVLEIISDLADYVPLTRDAAGISPVLEQFFTDLRGIFGRLAILADWLAAQAGLSTKLQELGTVLQQAFSGLRTAIDTMMALIDLNKELAKTAVDWVAIMDTVHQAISIIIATLRVMKDGMVILGDVVGKIEIDKPLADYADLLSKVLSPFQAAISITRALIELSKNLADQTFNWVNIMDVLHQAVTQLVTLLKTLKDGVVIQGQVVGQLDLGTEQQQLALVAYSETLSKILAPLQAAISITGAAIDLAKKLEDATVTWSVITQTLTAATTNLVNMLKDWKDGTNRIGLGTAEQQTALLAFAEMLGKLLSPMQTVISVTSAAVDLADKVAKGTVNLSDAIAQIDLATRALVGLIVRWSGAGIGHITITKTMTEFAASLGAVLSLMQTVISVVSSAADLSGKIEEGIISWAKVIDTLNTGVRKLLDALQQWATDTDILATIAAVIAAQEGKFVDNLTKALSPISAAVSAISSLIDLHEKLGTTAYNWAAIMREVTRAMAAVLVELTRLAQTQVFKDALAKIPKEFSEALQNAFGPMKAAIEALQAIATYTGMARLSATDIPAQVQALANDVRDFMRAFAEAARQVDIGPEVKALGEALNAIIGPVKSYIDSFYWIWRYTSIAARSGGGGHPPGWIPPQFEAIANDLRLLVQAIANLAADPAFLAQVAKAKSLSESIQPVVTMVDETRKMLTDIGNTRWPTNLPAFMTVYVTAVNNMFAKLQEISLPTDISAFTDVVRLIDAATTTMRHMAEFVQYITGLRTLPPSEELIAIWNKVHEVISAAMQPVLWYDIGADAGESLIDGIIHGIAANLPRLISVVGTIPTAVAGALSGAVGGTTAAFAGVAAPVTMPNIPAGPTYNINAPLVTGNTFIFREEIEWKTKINEIATAVAAKLGIESAQYASITIPSV